MQPTPSMRVVDFSTTFSNLILEFFRKISLNFSELFCLQGVNTCVTSVNCSNMSQICRQGRVHKAQAKAEDSDDLIEVVNQLQEKLAASGHSLDISLPQIVVVGCQSAGKSSVLENVVGKEFLPRGSGVVTRRPTVVQLEPCDKEYAVFTHKGTENKYVDFQDVMQEIRDETLRDPGPQGFSSKPIFLKIYSPNVLKLTLVDLPGLIKVVIGDQSEDAIEDVRNMVLQYIKQPNALILAVSPANQDIANSDALEIAKSVDPERIRTIGVLTKLDLMDEGTDARDILENKKIPLKRGYVGVLNRSQKDIEEGRDVEYCFQKELHFFQSMPCYKHLAHKMGSPYLQKMLHFQLRRHIKESLPALRQELAIKLTTFRKELKDLEKMSGYNSNGANGVQFYMIKLIQKFITQIETEILGFSPDVNIKELSAGTLINYKLYTDVQNGLNLPQIPGQKELMTIIISMHGMRNCWSIPSLALDAVGSHLLTQYIEPLNNCVDNLARIFHFCMEKNAKSLDQYPNLRTESLYLISKSIDDAVIETKESLLKHIEAEKYFTNIHHPDFVFPEFNISETMYPVKLWSSETSVKIADNSVSLGDSGCSSISEETECVSTEAENIMNALALNKHAKKNADLLAEMVKRYLEIQQKQISDTAVKYIAFFLVKGVLDYIKTGLIPTILGSPNSEMLLDDVANDLAKMKELRVNCDYLDDALKAVQSFQ